MICFEKMGSQHTHMGINCQDFASHTKTEIYTRKLVTDGCGSTPYADVGVRLYHQSVRQYDDFYKPSSNMDFVKDRVQLEFPHLTEIIFKGWSTQNMLNLPEFQDKFIFDNLLFTILNVIETEDSFYVWTLGDGYIIYQDHNDNITFENLDCGEKYPKYYGYNLIKDREKMDEYKDEVLTFREFHYLKSDWKNIGVASDGIRFILNLPDHDIERQRFIQFLVEGKGGKIKMLINRNPHLFGDDVSISF